MKYVALIRQPKELLRTISKFRQELPEQVRPSHPLGPHCTLVSNYFYNDLEPIMIEHLGRIRVPSFQLTLGKIDFFDDNSLVVRVEPQLQLQQLHQSVLDTLNEFLNKNQIKPLPEKYRSEPEAVVAFQYYGSCYVGARYNPHITIAQTRLQHFKKIKTRNYFGGYSFEVTNFELAKKNEAGWETVKSFSLL